MASINSTENTSKNTCFIDESRGEIALNASYEIESLAQLMINVLNQHYVNDDHKIDPVALRGLSMRIKDLNSVIMSATGDSSEDNRSLNSRFSGHSYAYMSMHSNF